MYDSDDVSNKLRRLTSTLRDTSDNLKSLDYLVINSLNDYRAPTSYLNETVEKSNSFSKIEQSLENISGKQNNMEFEMKRISNTLKDKSDFPNYLNLSKISHKAASTNFLDAIEPGAETAFNVNKKLQDAQDKLQSERLFIENRKTIDISPELKTLLIESANSAKHPTPMETQQLEMLNKRIIKVESENSTFKFELESTKRQLSNEIKTKNSILSKVEISKSKIHDLEQENIGLKKELDRISMENEINKKKADNNGKCQEKLFTLQNENEQLKKELKDSCHPSEMNELRRQKEKAERSKVSLKDQISDMTKQVDSKQTHILKLIEEVRDLQDKLSFNKSKLNELEERYHENQNELKHRYHIHQEALNKVENLEHSIIELEVDKNKGFSMRDDNIERLENQCARLKNEIDKCCAEMQEHNYLMNDLHKENESLRNQLSTVHTQTDALRKEMEALIKARCVQDEILKRREEDNENCQSKNKELQSMIENAEKLSEKYKFDAEIYNEELNQVRETVAVQDERIYTLTTENLRQHEQQVIYKSEISSLTRQLANLESHESNLKKQLMEYKNQEEHIDRLQRHLDESQYSIEKMSDDIERKSKKIDFEKENNVKKLEQMLEAERAAMKVVTSKCDRLALEINRVHQDYWSRELLVQRIRKKYAKVKQDLENLQKQKEIEKDRQQNNFNEERIEQEEEMSLLRAQLEDHVVERDQTLRWIILDLDSVVELLSQVDVNAHENSQLKSSSYLIKNSSLDLKSCPLTSSALSTLGGLDLSKCVVEIKSKFFKLRSGINLIINQLETYRSSNQELLEEMGVVNERMKCFDEEKQTIKDVELEDARRCIAKLRAKGKNEINLQLKCERLQDELLSVRKYLNGHLMDSNKFHCQNPAHH